MRALVVAALVGYGALALADAAPPAPHKSNFHFVKPPEWEDQSPGDHDFYTVFVQRERELVFQAKVQPGGDAATKELMERYAEDARKSIKRRVPDIKFEVIDRHLVPMLGTTAARFVFETTPPGKDAKPIKTLQFYLPAGGQHAILTFTAPHDTWNSYVPLFEAIAKSTQLLVKPEEPSTP